MSDGRVAIARDCARAVEALSLSPTKISKTSERHAPRRCKPRGHGSCTSGAFPRKRHPLSRAPFRRPAPGHERDSVESLGGLVTDALLEARARVDDRENLFRRPVEPFAEIVANARLDETLGAPSDDRRPSDANQLEGTRILIFRSEGSARQH